MPDYLAVVRGEGDALAAAAEGKLDRPVPACPGWDVADLVWHTAGAHWFWREVASRRAVERPELERPERPAADDLLAWYRDNLTGLVGVLTDTDPATPMWTWAPQQDVAFILRRMAQETAVHRWDAESATGEPAPIETRVAIDGIDEFFDFFLEDAKVGATDWSGSVHLHCTDGPGEWIVRVDGTAITVDRAHEKGDAAVRGPASDLLLLLWRRMPAARLEVLGDAATLERFLERTDLD